MKDPRTGKRLVSLLCLILPFCPPVAEGEGPPLNFAEAAARAVAASEELKNEYALQAIREGAWTLGVRAYFPKFSLTVSEDDRLSKIDADSFIKNYSLSADQLLWDGGKTAMERRMEGMELGMAKSRLEAMAAEASFSALAAYRQVILSRRVLEIREAAFASLAEQRRLLAQEAELGLAMPADLAEADIALGEERINIEMLRMELVELERRFAGLLGLKELPELTEKADTADPLPPPGAGLIRSLAEARNRDLAAERALIVKRQAELKYLSLEWLPAIRLTASFGLSGQRYPLTRYTWSVGIGVDFSSPWFRNSLGFTAGGEPPHDRTARLQNSLSPLPDPAAGFNRHSAELALALERKKYRSALEELDHTAGMAVERYGMADQKRLLALEAAELAGERYRLLELRQRLGQLTRIELMEARLEYAGKESAAVEAAMALYEAREALERLVNMDFAELEETLRSGS
jgi:outer membrane protein TolC